MGPGVVVGEASLTDVRGCVRVALTMEIFLRGNTTCLFTFVRKVKSNIGNDSFPTQETDDLGIINVVMTRNA